MSIKNSPVARVLIANRGEIAVRVIRTLRELNIQSVAIYSEADANSLHRNLADFAVPLAGNTSQETYLNIPKLLHAIELSGADAVHPGYGFLSENPEFAEAVTKAGVKFIGPSAKAMRIMGDKVEAKRLMRKSNVPVVPGSEGQLSSWQALQSLADEIGYPIILKASAGGGGRGMRVVRSHDQLHDAFAACTREAQSYFGNPAVFAERYVENPHHIEIQVLCDGHGNGVHLFERDCSVQRRHQKLIEEAPSHFLDHNNRMRLGDIAVQAAVAAGYEGVGTVEFICESPEKTYFMEMNTRIQVEHPVTEMITGIDLIAQQILVARGEMLNFTQADIELRGWAIEARINAEDATKGFLPAPGRITKLRLPSGPFVRVDTHIYAGYVIPSFYDSMIAKVIVWGRTRKEALARMARSLAELEIAGIPTTARFHEAVLQQEEFASGNYNTGFIEKYTTELENAMSLEEESLAPLVSLLATLLVQDQRHNSPALKSDERRNWHDSARLEATRHS